MFRRRVLVCTCVLGAWGCGDAVLEAPFPLKSLDDLPECVRDPEPSSQTSTATSAADHIAFVRENSRAFARTQFLVLASLTAESIRSHADEVTWSETFGDEARGSIIEGRVIAQGETWGVVETHFTFWLEDELFAHSVEVRSDLRSTVYDAGAHQLSFYDSLYEFDDEVRGCNPETGLRFERRTQIAEGGEVSVYRCWNPAVLGPDGSIEVLANAPECAFFLDAALRSAKAGPLDRATLPRPD